MMISQAFKSSKKRELFIHLPRITSGYEYSDATNWTIANGITSIGVFSHFISPDDVLAEASEGRRSWKYMSDGLRSLLKNTKEKYPWLRSMTASEASYYVKHYAKSEIFFEDSSNKKIGYINHFSGQLSFILRTNKKIGSVKGCKVQQIEKGVFHVMATNEIFEIELR